MQDSFPCNMPTPRTRIVRPNCEKDAADNTQPSVRAWNPITCQYAIRNSCTHLTPRSPTPLAGGQPLIRKLTAHSPSLLVLFDAQDTPGKTFQQAFFLVDVLSRNGRVLEQPHGIDTGTTLAQQRRKDRRP